MSLANAELREFLGKRRTKEGGGGIGNDSRMEEQLKDLQILVKEEQKQNNILMQNHRTSLLSNQPSLPFGKYEDQIIPSLKSGKIVDFENEPDDL